ncbi:MAG: hypothetical protein ACREQ9_07535 [Candidatus Binatia bacterium]
MKTIRSLTIATAIAACLLASPAIAADRSIEEMIGAGVDHEAIAARYDADADEASASAAAHWKMGERYTKAGGAAVEKHHLDEHCRKLANAFDGAAKEYAALAAAHREMAQAAK